MGRGMLTEEVKAKALEVMGLPIDQVELRLMPYVHYCVINEQAMEPRKVNQTEREILQVWRDRGWLEGGASAGGPQITREFYDILNEIIWVGYIDYTL